MGRLTWLAPPLGSALLFHKKNTSMANTKSAAKRARQTTKRAAGNKRVSTAVKTQLRDIRAAVAAGKKDEAIKLLPKVSSATTRPRRRAVSTKTRRTATRVTSLARSRR